MSAPNVSESRSGWFSRLLTLAPGAKSSPRSSDLAFPPGFLSSLERLRLAALKALGGGLREGHRLGAYKGGQLEFHGHRNYVAGDELRYIDWNSFARLGKPFIKEFAREEAGILHLLVDATPSMLLGHPDKWTFARRIALLFVHVALASKDLARVHLFDARGRLESFPKRGASASTTEFLAFFERTAISAREAGELPSATALESAVAAFLKTGPARGRVMLLSDFWMDHREVASAVAKLGAAGHDPAGFHILASEEITPACEGEIVARSLEEDGEIRLFESHDLPQRYARELERHRAGIEESFRRRGGQYLFCDTTTPIEKILIATLRQQRWVV